MFLERLEERCLLSSGLVAAYGFDEGSGSTLHDSSGNGNNGTITNATWSTAGKYGDALSFNGSSNSWVSIPNSASLDLTSAMTLEAWVDPTSLSSADGGWVGAVAKDHASSSNTPVSYALYAADGTSTGPGSHIMVGQNDNGAQGSSVLSLNTWSFLASTFNGHTLSMYVNGTLVGSKSVAGSMATTTNPLRIGGDWADAMFTGLIDNVRIYNTVLTQSQIQTDMNTPVDPAVTSETPAPGASSVAVTSGVTATFDKPVQTSSINFTLQNSSGTILPATLSYNSSTNTATLTPGSALAYNTKYTATVSGAKDSAAMP